LTILRFYDENRAAEKQIWISAYTTTLDSYLLKKGKEFKREGLIDSVKINELTSRIEVITCDGNEVTLSKVCIGIWKCIDSGANSI